MTAGGRVTEQAGPIEGSFQGAGASSHAVSVPVRIDATSEVVLQYLRQEGWDRDAVPPDVHPALERGALVRMLSAWQMPSVAVKMVTLRSSARPSRRRSRRRR